MSMTTMIQNSISSLASSIHALYNSSLYMISLKNFLEIKTFEFENEIKYTIDSINSIEICHLSYCYSNHHQALRNINFKIEKGETIAIVGKNGSGKSTLLKLLCGLYCPSEGIIRINDINLSEINPASYRNAISVLFQDFLRFEGSLLENVHLGDIEKKVEKTDIKHALQSADINFLKDHIGYQYDRFLGSWFENGSQLSGGEWQKVALARAYYKDASLYILDEPSSNLDIIAEMKIFENFFKRRKGKIGIFITHRMKIAKHADRIIVLNEGVVSSMGSHDHLYKHCDLYKELLAKENE